MGKECGSILSSHLWGGALRDNTKNSCVADYLALGLCVNHLAFPFADYSFQLNVNLSTIQPTLTNPSIIITMKP